MKTLSKIHLWRAWFIALTTSLLPLFARAQFTFSTNADNTLAIAGYNAAAGLIVVIPSNTNGYPVTAIGDDAFLGLSAVTSVMIPNSITSIGGNAFYHCSSLTNIAIPDSVTSIGGYAFYQCSGLTNVTIGNNVTNIGDDAFESCSGLPSVTIPNSVTSIGDNAFSICSGLKNVTIPNSVTSMGNYVFAGCSSLTNIAVDGANPSYASLSRILFNKTLTELVECPGGFVGSYEIPNTVTIIDGSAFYYCSGLSSITIPNSVINIGFNAFYSCSSLTNVTIGNSVTNIGSAAFRYCTSLHQAFFRGNAPSVNGKAGSTDTVLFNGETGKAYRLPGTTGWGSTFGGFPTALWYQPQPQILGSGYGLGVKSNKFNFTISWATNTFVTVEASTNLQNWTPVITNALVSGTNAFSDSAYTNFSQRFYRVHSQ